ncbi:arsenite S-adenosylmethyltransferase [Longibacter salinarum]|uniref:Arsenite methyltransferase n=1 Tax=Longibacter salinarum TaxID=1850348 RepID=A0A2A8CXG3_9BACT|nr:arsenite methyltransferase [Longibacter salinarum]PEN13274.1 arsenite S-adenosylmethyltransferase [Longibacter salinarum]
MTTPDDVKASVREKYAAIARSKEQGDGSSCCCSGDDELEVTMIGDDYDDVEGYVAEADMQLGCGVPTDLANIQPGDAVLDLGSGAGLDAFTARHIAGPDGRVVGVDMTPEMIKKARANAASLGFDNVEFFEGDIEDLPLEDEQFDVVISNCVLNLVPDKPTAFAEMYRVIAPGGHFCVSDIVVRGQLPDAVRRSAEMYAGCVGGAIEEDDYLELLEEAGFENVEVLRRKTIDVPDEALLKRASKEEVATFRDGGAIESITVRGQR